MKPINSAIIVLIRFALITLSFLFVLTGCNSTDKSYKTISVDEFSQLIANENVQRLDVRKQDEFQEKHIPSSLHIDVLEDDFISLVNTTLDKKRPIALYCRSGKRSQKASEILTQAGFEVYELEGGFFAWEKAGKEIEK